MGRWGPGGGGLGRLLAHRILQGQSLWEEHHSGGARSKGEGSKAPPPPRQEALEKLFAVPNSANRLGPGSNRRGFIPKKERELGEFGVGWPTPPRGRRVGVAFA